MQAVDLLWQKANQFESGSVKTVYVDAWKPTGVRLAAGCALCDTWQYALRRRARGQVDRESRALTLAARNENAKPHCVGEFLGDV